MARAERRSTPEVLACAALGGLGLVAGCWLGLRTIPHPAYVVALVALAACYVAWRRMQRLGRAFLVGSSAGLVGAALYVAYILLKLDSGS